MAGKNASDQVIDLEWAIRIIIGHKWLLIVGTAAATVLSVLVFTVLTFGKFDVEIACHPVTTDEATIAGCRQAVREFPVELAKNGFSGGKVEFGNNGIAGTLTVKCRTKTTNLAALEKNLDSLLGNLWFSYVDSLAGDTVTNLDRKIRENGLLTGELKFLLGVIQAGKIPAGAGNGNYNPGQVRDLFGKDYLSVNGDVKDVIDSVILVLPSLGERQKAALVREMTGYCRNLQIYLDQSCKKQQEIHRLFREFRGDPPALEKKLAAASPYFLNLLRSDFNRTAIRDVSVRKVLTSSSLFKAFYMSLSVAFLAFIGITMLTGYVLDAVPGRKTGKKGR